MSHTKRWSSILLLLAAAILSAVAGCAHTRQLLKPGDQAPAFQARDQEDKPRTLAEFKGHPVVLYFYPKDATPGCTKEACAFRDSWQKIQATGAVILGVSTDTVSSHAKFAQDHELPFPLLSDHDESIAKAYGVTINGLGMASRVTYLIDDQSRIAKVYPKVDPGVHAQEIIQALEALPKPAAP